MAEFGTLRISHYRVEQELSRDGLGYFFRALDEQLGRQVVLRVARAGQLYEGEALVRERNRIREQARSAAQLSHPNLVTIHEFRALSETDLVVMELVDGETLESAHRAGQRWSVLDMARLLARVADALAGAHAVGLVHGNVNARNIRVRPDGRVKLLDLGIPKLDSPPSESVDAAADVRDLARVACDVLGPPAVDEVPPGFKRRDPLADPVLGRAQFGFLAPVLTRAIRDPQGYESAGAFRDALLQAMDMATSRAPAAMDIEAGFGTHPVGPGRGVAPEDMLPPDSRTLAPLGRAGVKAGPRLVLPPDLAERAPDLENTDLFVVSPAPHAKTGLIDRLFEHVGPGFMIGGALFLAAAIAAVLLLQRGAPPPPVQAQSDTSMVRGGGPPLAPAPLETTPGVPAGGGLTAATQPAESLAAPAATSSGLRPLFTAWVRARPPGTQIRVLGQDRAWRDTVELSVPAGDTLQVEFSRAGYVTQRQPFNGSRLVVALEPDSVFAEFDANVAADVFVIEAESTRRLGTTPTLARLARGEHRILYRAAGQPEWQSTQRMPRAGQTYRVNKTDYVTTGSLIATVANSWAMVTVDGTTLETPARFDGLPAGVHVVRVAREGFQAITDTVVVPANQVLRRQYTLRR
jgi:tRNA A-37 threonylcarbamoyl transferase component Bud32